MDLKNWFIFILGIFITTTVSADHQYDPQFHEMTPARQEQSQDVKDPSYSVKEMVMYPPSYHVSQHDLLYAHEFPPATSDVLHAARDAYSAESKHESMAVNEDEVTKVAPHDLIPQYFMLNGPDFHDVVPITKYNMELFGESS